MVDLVQGGDELVKQRLSTVPPLVLSYDLRAHGLVLTSAEAPSAESLRRFDVARFIADVGGLPARQPILAQQLGEPAMFAPQA